MTSLFYSVKRNVIDGPYEFVKAIEAARELVLCTGSDVQVARLFATGEPRFRVELRDLCRAALKWFVVSAESRFENGKLHVKYMTEPCEDGWVTRRIDVPIGRPARRTGPRGP